MGINQSTGSLVSRSITSNNFLIRHRELVRDIELQKLESESQKLLKRLREIDDRKLAAELQCFKDVLALQQHLSTNGEPHN